MIPSVCLQRAAIIPILQKKQTGTEGLRDLLLFLHLLSGGGEIWTGAFWPWPPCSHPLQYIAFEGKLPSSLFSGSALCLYAIHTFWWSIPLSLSHKLGLMVLIILSPPCLHFLHLSFYLWIWFSAITKENTS